jgi:hypothetical protein
MFVKVCQSNCLVDIFVWILCPGGREIDDGAGELAAEPALLNYSGTGFGEKVVVGEAGCTGSNHFGCREASAAFYEIIVNQLALKWPDALL